VSGMEHRGVEGVCQEGIYRDLLISGEHAFLSLRSFRSEPLLASAGQAGKPDTSDRWALEIDLKATLLSIPTS
jgi:hypothetical protein